MKVVLNSTPLIALSLVGKLDILKNLFDEVIVPRSVFEEVAVAGKGKPGSKEVEKAKKDGWLSVFHPNRDSAIPPNLLGLDRGEMDVILIAQEVGADLVLIDEKAARK